jgi:hypothetical protein
MASPESFNAFVMDQDMQSSSILAATQYNPTPLATTQNNQAPMAPPPGSSARDIIVQTDFTAAWVPSTDGDMYDQPPGGWDVDGISTGENAPFLTQYWSQFNDAQTGFPTSNDSLSAAGAWWSAAGLQDEWLITPPMDLSGHMNTRALFNAVYTMPSYGAGVDEHFWLKVSTDGGFTWTPLFCFTHDDPPAQIPGVRDVPAWPGCTPCRPQRI